jgi:hypothetical protein
MTRLLPCPSCQRHVRVDATTCPFCAVALELSAPPLPAPTGRLTRAAAFAGAALLGTACGSSAPQAKEPPQNGPVAAADAGADQVAEPPDAAPAPPPPPYDPHNTPMPYGAPPARDRLV